MSRHTESVVPGKKLARRAGIVVAALALSFGLAACGGGGNDGSQVSFDVGVLVGGQPAGGGVQSGAEQSISIPVGQSIELDASEPVDWTLEVGGSAVTGSGTTVYYAGVYITLTALSPSRIVVDTSADYALQAAVPIRLTATSTYDSAEVATMNVYITN